MSSGHNLVETRRRHGEPDERALDAASRSPAHLLMIILNLGIRALDVHPGRRHNRSA